VTRRVVSREWIITGISSDTRVLAKEEMTKPVQRMALLLLCMLIWLLEDPGC